MTDPLFDVSGKVVVISGASSGLGNQASDVLGRRGARVVLVARREARLKDQCSDLQRRGIICSYYVCDVSIYEQVQQTIEKIVAETGRIDVLVNAAGVSKFFHAESPLLDYWQKIMDINVSGSYYMCAEVGKQMIQQKKGSIINFASVASFEAPMNNCIVGYCSSKGAVAMLTKSLAVEWAKYGIRVNAVAPGWFHTEMTDRVVENGEVAEFIKDKCPMRRIGRKGELDGAILYLASEASSYVTGAIIPVDGGTTAT